MRDNGSSEGETAVREILQGFIRLGMADELPVFIVGIERELL
jgi:hypothetical protein